MELEIGNEWRGNNTYVGSTITYPPPDLESSLLFHVVIVNGEESVEIVDRRDVLIQGRASVND